MTVEEFLTRLERVKPHGSYHMARCPGHEDNRESLSVSLGNNGGIVLKCHAGCGVRDIVQKLGLTLSDLFPPKEKPEPTPTQKKTLLASYDYTDENGKLLYQALRYQPKEFRQRAPDGTGEWSWSLQGVRRVPYALPKVIEQASAGKAVFVVEGEKDADALAAMVEQSKSFAEIAADASQFNLKPWQVPFQNGVWDRGQWRGHQRQDFTEHLLPVCYDQHADRSEWDALLSRMTGGDVQLARTLQDVAGYCFSGASTLRLLPWAYGPKGTGKSTFAELLQTALGAAGKTLDSTLLSGDRESERLGAAVRSMRAVFLPESGRKRLDAELLKMLTGSDRIPCRLLYSNLTFSVMPSWAVFAVANDPPSMNAHDEALRDRVIALPFIHKLDQGEELTFADGKRLEEVRRKPDSALVAGFVAWAVEGLERVHEAQAVYKAPVVTEHTRKFWDETDPLTPFWEGLDKSTLERGMAASALHQSYVAWCEKEGQKRPLQGRAFASACRAAGLEQKRGEKGIVWYQPSPSLPLQSTENPVGMYEKPPFSQKSPKKESIGDFTKNSPESYIPTGFSDSEEPLDDPFAPGGSMYQAPAEPEEEIF